MKTYQSIFLALSFFLFACSQSKVDQESFDSSADSVSASELSGDVKKLVKTASMNFKVADVYESAKNIADSARKLGGMVTHYDISAMENNTRRLAVAPDSVLVISSYVKRAEMTVRVPAMHLDKFMNNVSTLASFIHNSSLDIDDKSLDYLESNMKQRNRLQSLNTVEPAALVPSQKATLINQQDRLVEEEIKSKKIDAQVRYSVISLSFSQNALVSKETIVNSDVERYSLPLSRSLSQAFYVGWDYFLNFIVAIAHLWMFILVAVVTIFGFKFYKKQRDRKADINA